MADAQVQAALNCNAPSAARTLRKRFSPLQLQVDGQRRAGIQIQLLGLNKNSTSIAQQP